MEIWKEIANYSKYDISDKGRIRNNITNRILRSGSNQNGYLMVRIKSDNGQYKMFTLHRLVLTTFSPNPNPELYTDINHKNNDKKDNSLENLEWCTHLQNVSFKNKFKTERRTLELLLLKESKRSIKKILETIYGTKDN